MTERINPTGAIIQGIISSTVKGDIKSVFERNRDQLLQLPRIHFGMYEPRSGDKPPTIVLYSDLPTDELTLTDYPVLVEGFPVVIEHQPQFELYKP